MKLENSKYNNNNVERNTNVIGESDHPKENKMRRKKKTR